MSARRRSPHLVIAIVILVALAGPLAPANGFVGADWFAPGTEYDQNFPDPHVLFHDGVYYAYATNTGGPLLPAMSSDDMQTWIAHDAWPANPWSDDPFFNDALVRPPAWADSTGGGELWAPFVIELGGSWRAYYAIREAPGRYCISVAWGPGPLGPFEDHSSEPITCGYGPAGAIDPWVYVDDRSRPWLVWKTEPYSRADRPPNEPDDDGDDGEDGEVDDEPEEEVRFPGPMGAALWSHRLTSNGSALIDVDRDPETEVEPNLLLVAGAPWEAGIIENPAMVDIGEQLVLFYSGHRWDSHEYATSWATCWSIAGPCWRAENEPFLRADGELNGPGGASVFVDEWGDHRIAFHAWNAPFISYPDYPACDTDGDGRCTDQGQRFLHVESLCWIDGGPHVGIPDSTPFCDVPAGSWQTAPIAWMAEQGITTGASPVRFAPERTVTRAEAVTFLWRLAGEPVPSAPAAFDDVSPGTFFADAVAWAAEQEIVLGITPTSFEPDGPLTRGQMATILHRAAGTPAGPASAAGFVDVAPAAFFADAVDWMAATGVTSGTSPLTFSPFDPVTRSQMAAFLCRYTRVPVEDGVVQSSALPCDSA
ncbi:MAG: S-layer homology domain-containing protein [Actinomycetota bacterium]